MIYLSVAGIINVIFVAVGLGICSVSVIQVGSGMHIRKEAKGYLQVFFTMINVYLFMYLFRILLEGHPGNVIRVIIHIVTFTEMVVSGVMIYLFSILVLFVANPTEKVMKLVNRVLLVLVGLHVVGMIIDQFSNFFYSFDESNFFHRERGFLASFIMHMLMLCQNVFLLIRYREKIDKKLLSALWLYILLPLAGIGLQIVWPDVQFFILASIIGAAYLYFIIISIQITRYHSQQIEKDRIDNELTMATRIQSETLPNIFPAFPDREDFNIHASMNPAKEVGGDFYDFFLLDDTHLGIVMADVSGKGIPAALFMMVSKILIQNIAMMGNSPEETLKFVNNQLCSNNPEDMFVTVWYGSLDLETGTLTAASAGHEYPYLKMPDGRFEMVKDRHGLVIGGMPGVNYKQYELYLEPGSKLFLYTDGVPEATNAEQELFGPERLLEALRGAEDKEPKDILTHVESSVKAFVKEAPQFDDLTMLCLEYHGPKVAK